MKEIEELLTIMRSLRDENRGCPWDLAQTHRSLAGYTLEEAYEVVCAIEEGSAVALCDELGDLLFQIVFHAQMAAERQQFEFTDVVNAICEKMTQRHPHVFSDAASSNAERLTLQEHNQIWEQSKRQKRDADSGLHGKDKGVLDGIAGTLPATNVAMKLQKRAASVGFDWKSITPIFAKVMEELEEVRVEVQEQNRDATEDEIGDLLFAVINLSRHAEVDPESALRRANRKFERRFRQVEHISNAQKKPLSNMTMSELQAIWDQVKQQEAAP